MAYDYDQMGNYTGYDDEEERRRREEAARQAQLGIQPVSPTEIKKPTPVKQTITTDPDTGEQTIKIEGSAKDLSADNPRTPTLSNPAPVDPAEYNRRIASMESGANPNIGYHDQSKSTAFGPHGMTAGAWKDAQRLDPNLAGVDITRANPEQLTAGMNAYTRGNANTLEKIGIPVTANTLAAAHFAGATGLKRFLDTGEISPAMAAANGGEEKARQILQSRLGGGAAPASGAAQQANQPSNWQGQTNEFGGMEEQPQQPQQPAGPVSPESIYSLGTGQGNQGIRGANGQLVTEQTPQRPTTEQPHQAYQGIQDDLSGLISYSKNEDMPEHLRNRAKERAYELLNTERQKNLADEKAKSMVAEGKTAEMGRVLTSKPKDEEGSWLKMILLSYIAPGAAAEEAVKLGLGSHKYHTATITDEKGNEQTVEVKQRSDGKIVGGNTLNGTPLTDEQLSQAAGGINVKGTHQAAEVYKDPSGQVKGSFVLETRPGQTPVYKEVGTGRKATGAESAVLNKMGVGGTLEQQAASQQQKLGMKLQYEPAIAAATKGAGALGEFNAMNGTNFAIAGRDPQGMPLLVDQTTGQILTKPAAANVAPAGAPVAPGQVAAGATPAPTGITPEQVKQNTMVTGEERKDFLKKKEEIVDKGEKNASISSIRRRQIDTILDNPELAGMIQGGGRAGSESMNLIRDIVTGKLSNENGEEYSRRIAALGLKPGQQAALEQLIQSQRSLAPLTLKENAGAGSVSDSEQKANRDAGIDLTKQSLYGGLANITRDKFDKDMASYRRNFVDRSGAQTATQESNAWAAEKKKYEDAYNNIYSARAKYVQANGYSQQATVEAFRQYPNPEFNPQTGQIEYGGRSKEASRKSLASFNR